MRLNLLFSVMTLLTILAYPLVFIYGKLRLLIKSILNINPVNSSLLDPVKAHRHQTEII